jgi:hypothetical protein
MQYARGSFLLGWDGSRSTLVTSVTLAPATAAVVRKPLRTGMRAF